MERTLTQYVAANFQNAEVDKVVERLNELRALQ